MEFIDRSHYYEVGNRIAMVGRTELLEAHVRATGTRVVLHRIALDDPGYDSDTIRIELQQEALLVNPRVPLLIDAWRSEREIVYVRLEYSAWPIDSPEGRAALHAAGGDVFEEAAFQSLAALAALHDLTLTHKYLTLGCFVVTPTGLVVLRDTGLWRRINERLTQDPNAFVFSLSSKSARRDVAEWGTAMAEFAAGRSFGLIEEDGLPTATPEEIERMQAAIRSSGASREVADMVCEALEAFNNVDVRGYENAARALDKFPRRMLA